MLSMDVLRFSFLRINICESTSRKLDAGQSVLEEEAAARGVVEEAATKVTLSELCVKSMLNALFGVSWFFV